MVRITEYLTPEMINALRYEPKQNEGKPKPIDEGTKDGIRFLERNKDAINQAFLIKPLG